MKQKPIKLMMLAGAMALANMMLTACTDDDDSTKNGSSAAIGAFNYQRLIPSGGSAVLMVLDSLQSNVVSATSNVNWIQVTPFADESGKPCVKLNVSEITGENKREGYIMATDDKGNNAKVSICQYPANLGDLSAGSNDVNVDDWIKNWDKYKKIAVVGLPDSINTPWSNPETTADPKITHVTKAQGWEMAFSYLYEKGAPNTRFFALYNRYLGLLRVFCYVPAGMVPNGEAYFEVIYGSPNPTAASTYFPFYNSLGYSIPTSKSATGLDFNANISGFCNETFHHLITPYTRSVSKTVSVGWNVFDINMHGFVPQGTSWRNQGDGEVLFIHMVNFQDFNVNLNGLFNGQLNGSYTPPEIVQKNGGSNTTDGICSVMGTVNSILSGFVGSGPGGYARDMMSWNKFKEEGSGATGWNRFMMGAKTYAGYASIGLTIANGLFKALGHNVPEYYDTIPGKINMTMNGTISLSGNVSSWGSNNIAGLSVYKNAIKAMNVEGHMGEGVVSLAEDPVICVAKEDLLADVDNLILNIQSDGRYKNSDIENYGLRLITFLDPTSIKLNLNTELFKDLGGVSDVVVTPTWGVYPETKFGSTDAMRQAIKLEGRPTVSLKQTQEGGNLALNTTNSEMRLHELIYYRLMNTEISDPETRSNCKMVTAKGTNIRYYGREQECGGKKIMVQPQIYVPYYDGYAYDGIVPDIVVGITVSFHVKNNNPTADKPYDCFLYQLQYVPKIKLVSRAELKEYYEKIKECKQRWQPNVEAGEQEYPAGYVENDKSVPFYMPAICLQKSIDMLEKVTK